MGQNQDPELQKLLPKGYEDNTTVCCSSWLVTMLLDLQEDERKDAIIAWLHYTQGDFDYMPKTSAAKALSRQMRPTIKSNLEKRQRVIDGGKRGGSKSAEKRAEKPKTKGTKNQQVTQPPFNPLQPPSNPLNENVNGNENKNTPSNTPASGGVSMGFGGGGEFCFFDFFTFARRVYKTDLRRDIGQWVQLDGTEITLEKTLVCSFPDNELKNEIWRTAIEIGNDGTKLEGEKARALLAYLGQIKPRLPKHPDGALNLATKLAKSSIISTRKDSFAKYIDSHKEQWQAANELPSIFEGILNRIPYLESLNGKVISSTNGLLDRWVEHIGD